MFVIELHPIRNEFLILYTDHSYGNFYFWSRDINTLQPEVTDVAIMGNFCYWHAFGGHGYMIHMHINQAPWLHSFMHHIFII